jgi:hypothetical protein
VDGDSLGRVVRLVDAYKTVGQLQRDKHVQHQNTCDAQCPPTTQGYKETYLEHVVTQADDDKLGILGALLLGQARERKMSCSLLPLWLSVFAEKTHLDVVGDDRDILKVQRGVNLVHHVERRRLEVVEGEDQRQRAEGLLSTREIGNVFPALLRRANLDEDNER